MGLQIRTSRFYITPILYKKKGFLTQLPFSPKKKKKKGKEISILCKINNYVNNPFTCVWLDQNRDFVNFLVTLIMYEMYFKKIIMFEIIVYLIT